MNCEDLGIITTSARILREPDKFGYVSYGLGEILKGTLLGFMTLRAYKIDMYETVTYFPYKCTEKAVKYAREGLENFEYPLHLPETTNPRSFEKALSEVFASEMGRIIAKHYSSGMPIAIMEVGNTQLGGTLNVTVPRNTHLGLVSEMFKTALSKQP
ncbi:MAG: hypothetical protein WCO33_00150 [bacterium]